MNHEQHSFSSQNNSNNIFVNLDEFNIEEESFKPMTKGLGFHQDPKKNAVRPMAKDTKSFVSAKNQTQVATLLNPLATNNANKIAQATPTGLEAFYGAKAGAEFHSTLKPSEIEFNEELTKPNLINASVIAQFTAWIIDVLVVASFVVLTAALLVAVSGIEYKTFAKIISTYDIAIFGASLFTIYYLMYFTILDLSSSPGKTILGIRLVRSDDAQVSAKQTFTRALVTLLSLVALFLPTLLDFQGRLSETKVVK